MLQKKTIQLANKETYAYVEQGTGDRVLFLIHGNFSSSLYYKPLLERLDERFHVYAMDLRGYGDSSYHHPIHSLKDFARDIKLFADRLHVSRAIVVGWSLGGGVAMELAAHYPDLVDKLVLINSTTHKGYPIFKKDAQFQVLPGQVYRDAEEMANDPVQVKPLLDAFKQNNKAFIQQVFEWTIYTVNKPSKAEQDLYISETMKQRNLPDADFALASQNMSDVASFYNPGEATISQIVAPTLHFWGDKDVTVMENFVKDNIDGITSPSTYIRFEDCGHSPLVDVPDLLTQSIVDFSQ